MRKLRFSAILAVALALMGTGIASATLLENVLNQPTRFSGPCCVYAGSPQLTLTLSMVEAGGGPNDFHTVSLLKALTGKLFDPEVAKLTKQYGKANVTQFLKTFDFVVDDSLRIVTEKKVALPAQPIPDPTNGPALASALWAAGQTGQGYVVEVMLDRLVSNPIHMQVMTDIDAKYGLTADAFYHTILATAMKDLAAAYHLGS